MTGHHRCRSKPVCHSGRELVNTVTARGISHQVDALRIHILEDHQIGNQLIQQRIHVTLMPHVPGVGRSSWGEVDTFLGRVESFLIFPLLIIDTFGGTSASMHGNVEGTSALLGFPENLVIEFHFKVAEFDRL